MYGSLAEYVLFWDEYLFTSAMLLWIRYGVNSIPEFELI